MAISVEELNNSNCKTYLLSSGGEAALIDPVRERAAAYKKVLEERGLELRLILETHTHADHLMFDRNLIESFGVPVLMHKNSPSPLVKRHLADGDEVELGQDTIRVFHTPGHTLDSVCFVTEGAVFTGDTLLIGGSGRTDFPGGDAGTQYDAIVDRLFQLPPDTTVYPGHDYRGQTTSTIAREKSENPRVAGKSRDEYVELMANLNLPLPSAIQQSLQINQSGFDSEEVPFASFADVAKTEQVSCDWLQEKLAGEEPPLLIDVREPEEFVGDLGHIQAALPVPLDSLEQRLPKLLGYVDRDVVCVCRAGARSASACAMLNRAGFASVRNLQGGMLAWAAKGLPVQR